jgi:hypothetical protein
MDLDHVPKVFREPLRGFHDVLRQKPLSLLILLRVEFNFGGLPNNAVHVSGFCGEDGDIVELNAVSLVDTVFSYSRRVRMFQSDVPLKLLESDVQGTACLPFVHPATLTFSSP